NQVPYWIYGNRQDNGTMRGPSTVPEGGQGGRGGGGGGAGAGRGGRGGRGDSTAAAPGRAGRGAPGRGGRPAPRGSTAAQTRVAGGAGIPRDTASARRLGLAQPDSAQRDSAQGNIFGTGGASTWDHGLGGCESGFTLPDPTNADIVWASCYGNQVTRWN